MPPLMVSFGANIAPMRHNPFYFIFNSILKTNNEFFAIIAQKNSQN
jgi:hypothetical protein